LAFAVFNRLYYVKFVSHTISSQDSDIKADGSIQYAIGIRNCGFSTKTRISMNSEK